MIILKHPSNNFTNFFACGHSRQAGKEGGRRGGAKEKLWALSKEPLKQPLLRSLQGNSDLSHLACESFIDILYTHHEKDWKHVKHHAKW